jgi:hypothetical protein
MDVDLSLTNTSVADFSEPAHTLVVTLSLLLSYFFHPHADVKLTIRVKKRRLDLIRCLQWEVLIQETLRLLHQPAPRFVQKSNICSDVVVAGGSGLLTDRDREDFELLQAAASAGSPTLTAPEVIPQKPFRADKCGSIVCPGLCRKATMDCADCDKVKYCDKRCQLAHCVTGRVIRFCKTSLQKMKHFIYIIILSKRSN